MTTPFAFQREIAIEIEKFGGRCIVGAPPGTCKSFTAMIYARRHPELWPIIVVCPAALKWNWAREVKTHLDWDSLVLGGTGAPKRLQTNANVIIVNYDVLKSWWQVLRTIGSRIVILDEVHYLANGYTQRSKAAFNLCYGMTSVIGLSGTAITNRPIEIWNPCRIIKPALFPSMQKFAVRYSEPKRTYWGWTFNGAKNLDELHRILKKNVLIRRTKAELLPHLPPKRSIVVPIEISDRKEYQLAVHDFIRWLSGISKSKARKAVKNEAIVKLGYLKRLAAHSKMKNVFGWIDSFLAETNDKLLIFGVHRAILDKLQERYNKICVRIDGATPSSKRLQIVDQFQQNKHLKIFLGNIKAAGVGLNITSAATVAFVELAWTPGEHEQAGDRAHRQGQLRSVTAYYLVAQDTIEEKLCKILQQKQKVLNNVLDGIHDAGEMDIYDQLIEQMKSEDFSIVKAVKNVWGWTKSLFS